MGSGCGRVSENQPITNPLSSGNNPMNDELAVYMSLESPYNVNHKYTMFFPIIKTQRTGYGIRETFAYISKISETDLIKKRAEYWETRVEGQADMWQALRAACEAEDADAIGILKAVGLKLVNKSLQMAYDKQGEKYDVPIFCINEPKDYEVPKETKIDKNDIRKAIINIKLRCAGIPNDILQKIPSDMPVENLKAMFMEKSKLKGNPEIVDARFFYEGKELKATHLVGEYDIQDDRVITVFLRKNK